MQTGKAVPSEEDIQRILAKPFYLRTPEEDAIIRAAGLPFQGARDLGSFLRDDAQKRRRNMGFVESPVSPFPESGAFSLENISSSLNKNALPALEFGPASPAAVPTDTDVSEVVTGASDQTPTSSDIDMMRIYREIASGMRGTGAGTGIPTQAALKPYTDFFDIDPNDPRLQAPSFAPLIAQQETRGRERAAEYEQSIKRIEEEMKRERLGAVLTTLGANLMAGEGAMGLERAGAIAQQVSKEMRQELGAERRAAKASEDATSDRIFALNAQQLTADKEAQRAIFTAQQGVKEKAFNAFSKVMDNEVQANQAANQLAATLTVGAVNSMRDKIVTEGANARAVLDFAKEQARSLKDTLGTSTAGMKPEEIRKIVEDTLRSGLITGYAAIGQAPPAGLEAQIAAAAAAASKPTTSGQTSGRFAVSQVSGP